jgi:hypothetical protein
VKTQLLCTFAHRRNQDIITEHIIATYDLSENRMFLFCDQERPDDLYITYNIVLPSPRRSANTISIHRKKESNTLYSINALNTVIKECNNGVLDKSFIIPWQLYRNSLLLTDGDQLRQIKLKMLKRLDV